MDEEVQEVEQPQKETPELTNAELEKSFPFSEAAGPRPDINEQFPRQELGFTNGKVAFRDIRPDVLREGGDIPVVMMTGYGMNQEVIGNVTKGLYKAGQRAIPLDIVGGGKGIEGEEGTSSEINRQASLLKEWLTRRSEEKFTLLGQSMSAIVMLRMFEMYPELKDKIGSILLVSPMGLGGKDNLIDLGKRQLSEIKRDAKVEKSPERQEINKRVSAVFKEFLFSSPGRAVKEVAAIAGADEYHVLEKLKEKGIKTGIIQGDLDMLNSSERVWENIARQAGDPYKDDFVKVPPLKLNELTEEEKEKLRNAFREKEKLNQDIKESGKTPPFDSITMTAGGHEIFGPEAFARRIIRQLDYFDSLEDREEELVAKKHDTEELVETREELKEVTAETPPEQPQNPQT